MTDPGSGPPVAPAPAGTSKEPASRRLPLARRLLFAVLAVVIGLGLVEIGLRAFGLGQETGGPAPWAERFQPSAEFGWELIPGFVSADGASVRINAQGLRDRELAAAKLPGTLRILCLGDSVTFGHRVGPEEPYPRVLENLLRSAGGEAIEVINAGVPGYSTFQQAAWLDRRGLTLEPDIVILGFVLNDVVDPYVFSASHGGDRRAFGVDTTLTLDPLRRLLRRTSLSGVVRAAMRTAAVRRDTYNVGRLFDEPLAPEIAGAWQETEADLDQLVDSARRAGVPLLLVGFPYRFQLDKALPARPQARLAAWASRTGTPHLDLLPLFARMGVVGAFLDESHPTPEGHAAAAQAMADVILERGWLTASAAGEKPSDGR
jgi:lysophospholipase L1-like esterase